MEMSEKKQVNGPTARTARLVGSLTFVIPTAAICLLLLGSPLWASHQPALARQGAVGTFESSQVASDENVSTWHIETVDSEVNVGGPNSLALGRNGYPHISYWDGGALKYAYQDALGWHIETVEDRSGGSYISLALDRDGYPHIGYSRHDGRSCFESFVKYAYQDASGWHIETVEDRSGGSYISLALDRDGHPHISYSYSGLKYAYRDVSGWHIETVVESGGSDISLALDKGGYPHISQFECGGWMCPVGDLKYVYQDASGWRIEIVDTGLGPTGGYSFLALDDGGYPHISYCADKPNFYLKYAYQDASGWHIEIVEEASRSFVLYTSLALDGYGYPHISYCGGSAVKYAYQDASGWHFETVDSGGSDTSLALDRDGHPHISYYDRTKGDLKYASYPVFSMQSQDVGDVGVAGSFSEFSGIFTVEGSGWDIYGSADAFHYVYQTLYGDGEIVAWVISVENTDPWAKAGVMIRETLNADSKNVFIALTPGNGVTFQHRSSTGGSTSWNKTSGLSAPYWVKLVRNGDAFTAYRSVNGSSWTEQGFASISMASTVYIGLAVTSHNDEVLCTAQFDHVSVSGAGPILSIPSNIPAQVGQTVSVPVNFTSNGHRIVSTVFSVDFDQTCLAFDPTDSDQDGIPDAVTLNLPSAFNSSVIFDGNDTDGELDFFIADLFPPLASLPYGTLATITFTATCQPAPGTSIIAPVGFSDDPSASFGNTNGQSVLGTTTDGSVEVLLGIPGDCNSDGAVDAGDISALVLEIFDGDGNDPADVPGGTFPGDPVGCNANRDTLVDAGDISCTVLLIFYGPGTCGGGSGFTSAAGLSLPFGSATESESPSLGIPDQVSALPGGMVTLPINFTAHGHSISSLVFSVDYDQTWLTFDPTDSNGEGIPDAITFNLPGAFDASVTFDEDDTDGELDFFIADLFPPLASLSDGVIVSMTLNVGSPPGTTEAAVSFSPDPAPSFGDTSGQSVSGTTDNGSVLIVAPATDVYTVYLPLIHKHGPPLAKLGVDFGEFWVVVPEVIEYDFPVVREMGAGWMRVFLPWLRVETSPGEYHWEKYDPVFSRLGELGFDVMVVIYGAPDWAAEESCGPISDTLALESFLQVVVPRYAEVVDAWEFTNEPDGIAPRPEYGPAVGCWGLYPAEYARQLGIFYAQIKSLDPDALVFFGGLAYDYWERFARDFFEKALQNGAGLYFDGVSLHHYPINEAEFPTMASKVHEIRNTMSRNGVYGKRLWMTETGQWVNMGRSVEIQRDFIVRELTRGFGAGLDNIFWFDPREHEPWPWGGEVERYLISANHEPMNGYSTFQNFANKLEGMHCLGAYRAVPGGIEAYEFVGPERTLYILWSNVTTTTVSIPSATDALLTSRDGDESVVVPVQMGRVEFEVGVKPVFIEMVNSQSAHP